MKNKKNAFLLNTYIIVLALTFFLILYFNNVTVYKSSVVTAPGSYGEDYALIHNLHNQTMATSQLDSYNLHYELFDYYTDGKAVELAAYDGVSNELVIPESIDGKPVTIISEEFIQSLHTVSALYLPDTVEDIEGDADSSLTLYCSENCAFYQNYLEESLTEEIGQSLATTKEEAAETLFELLTDASSEADKDAVIPATNENKGEVETAEIEQVVEEEPEPEWQFETSFAFDKINFSLGDLPFEYNFTGSEIEITEYTGETTEILILPAYINGYPVTVVSLDFIDQNCVVIPSTVQDIIGKTSSTIYSPLFLAEIIFTVLAVLLALLAVDLRWKRYKKNTEECYLTGNQIIAVILYLSIQTVFALLAIYKLAISTGIAVIISLVNLAIYLWLLLSTKIGREHVIQQENEVQNSTARMKAIKAAARNISESVSDTEARKKVQQLEEEIRFSDIGSSKNLEAIELDIENMLSELKKDIAKDSNDDIIQLSEKIIQLVQERNNLCKAEK